tara:strand:+ start:4420 stop:4815 length:396 start_codon:yes stop_codon:yes gene_type:complete
LSNILGKSGFVIVLVLAGLLMAVAFLPQVRQFWLQLRADDVTITQPSARGGEGGKDTLDLRIITILGKDGIPAILNPEFVSAQAADEQMVPNERVIGVSINGDHRAYPLNLLSRHEIVNDTVGGAPVAVTW